MVASKAQLWAQVEAILASHKVKPIVVEELKEILAPKAGGGAINPPKEIDGVIHHFCRFHQAYEPEDRMVLSGGKSKGYCKASISKWNKLNARIKRLESRAVGAVCAGDLEVAKQLGQEAAELKSKLNDPRQYDIAEDWANFNN